MCGLRHRDDGPVPAARRPAGVLPQLLLGTGAGHGLSEFTAVAWDGDAVAYLDQRLLPGAVRYERARTVDEIVAAIASLAVRGAPCIGIFGGFGVALLRQTIADPRTLADAIARVRAARPTAVNLAWAVDRVSAADDPLGEAQTIAREQVAIDAAIAENGLELIPKGARILTHCNTGPLATAGGGTALGVIIAAQRAGKKPRAFVDETRPLLQGARLNYLELRQAGVDAVLQVDSAAAIAMARQGIDLVIVGADRIVRNGDTANKIGTYGLAILAAHHGIPFYVAAPRSTFDASIETGADIPIEERSAEEVTSFGGVRVAPEGAAVYNPAFDVTPGRLIAAFVTECGILRPPYGESIPALELRPLISVR
ncbi:MAG: S-methyl-5-thioribose-1-phosphate isomerase [Candidatus Eremiobacteraeota bacterium]|nr:S-methyl-5-thioribose-1-phosphate isomerase [Candidatus Eremiobacteraeota bacterium]